MRKVYRLTCMALGVASALALSACVVEDQGEETQNADIVSNDALDPTSGDITAKLTVDDSSVSASERVIVTLTLTNNAKHAVRLLGWYAPDDELEEDLFLVTQGADAADFTGPHYKRPAPETGDFVTLAPGKSVTRQVDLTGFYDLSAGGDYRVQYAANIRQSNSGDMVLVASNAVDMAIEARADGAAQPQFITAPGQTNLTSSISYASNCSASQQSTVLSALGAASTMANDAASYLGGGASGTPRYTTWFGAFSSNGWNTAKSHYAAIKDAFDTKPMSFDCGCKKKYYAYVYPNQPYKVYLCSVFWGSPLTGTDSKGGTIVHETSHFTATAGTDDWVYGQSGAKSLAISDPSKALDNADSHEYFAENTPNQQ